MGEKRQDNLRGKWVISGNFRPLSCSAPNELVWRQDHVIIWLRYDNVNEIFHAVATSPERPVVSVVFVTGHVAIQVNQFHRGYFTTQWNVKRTILSISRTKTHRWTIRLFPEGKGVCNIESHCHIKILIITKVLCSAKRGTESQTLLSRDPSQQLPATLEGQVSFRTALTWTLFFPLWKDFTSIWNQR